MGSSIARELGEFDRILREKFACGPSARFEQQAVSRMLRAPGKRLRPRMLLAAATCGTYDRDKVFSAAAAVELLHTATLVHDDIVDGADLRRGLPTLSAEHDAAVAVYTGDWLLCLALLALAESGLDSAAAAGLAKGVRAMCSGEIEQYFSRGETISVSRYLGRAMRKTGMLFAAACAAGAHLGGLPDRTLSRFARFGLNFGVAFQIRDDLLDLDGAPEHTGKTAGRDSQTGTATLPRLLPDGRNGALVLQEKYRAKALSMLDTLPDSEGRDELIALTGVLTSSGVRKAVG